ncbi:MAG TPA: HepT-like ribonuclease domain-containing protein [Vicinamibacterales bacterium]
MSRDDAHVLDILTAARRAETFVEGMTDAAFLDDIKTQSAVLHQLTVLGEAARRVSEGFRETHQGVPWKAMAGLRRPTNVAIKIIDMLGEEVLVTKTV